VFVIVVAAAAAAVVMAVAAVSWAGESACMRALFAVNDDDEQREICVADSSVFRG